MKKVLYILLLFVTNAYSQYSPNIHNFALSDYKGGNQNWDITRANNGKVYVANNNGLLEYDGMAWQFHQLPNKTTIRSVLAVNDLIFTGSYEEFGYWKKNKYGVLTYYSLSHDYLNLISSNEEIWGIVKFNNTIIFQSFSSIYLYDFKKIKKIKQKTVVISCSVIGDDLYISTLKQGIFLLKNETLTPFYSNDLLVNTKIVSINKHQEKLLIMTSLKGSFFLENGILTPTQFSINEQIKLHQLNNFSILDNGDMVYGTIKDGVFLTNKNGGLKFHINKENGLQNNTVLGQSIDASNNLWLGLDNGIANIELSTNIFFYNDISGKLGAVYDIIDYKGTVYIGTNTGLFKIVDDDKLKFIEGSQGQVWDLKIIDNDLFCGHNEGTFLVRKNEFKRISKHTGGWAIKRVPERKNVYIQGSYSGLIRFEKVLNQWNVKHLGKTTIPSRFLVFEDLYTAWVAHATKGVYRVSFNKNHDSILSVENYRNKGVNSDYNIRVYNIMNNIVFKTNEGWGKYEPILDSIIPFELLNDKLGKDSYIISEEDTDLFAIKNKQGFVSLKSLKKEEKNIFLNDKSLKDRYIVGYENVSKIKDSVYALNLNNGFMMIDSSFKTDSELFKPKIENVSIGDKPMVLTEVEKGVNLNFNQSLVVTLSSAKSINHFFEYNISEIDNIWHRIQESKVEFSNLSSGNYTVSFRTGDDSGNISETQIIHIDVFPPWYRDSLGMSLYLLITICIAILLYIMHNKKIVKEQQKLIRKKNLENEKRITQLKTQSLQNDIKTKQKQLANSAMALIKKNELLQGLKKEIIKNKERFENYYSYKKLIKKVDDSIEHKDESGIFEENFNQVHNEFFEILKKHHAQLTSKDLKICAYIKMNLYNKEIAPLMNISVRGIETYRYRLKKKLKLERDVSLVDYLLKIK